MSVRIWCCKCDVDMEHDGVALDCDQDCNQDCDQDGEFYRCPNCKIRIVVFKKKMSEKEVDVKKVMNEIAKAWKETKEHFGDKVPFEDELSIKIKDAGRIIRKKIEKLRKEGEKSVPKQSICPECSGLMEYRRKWKDQDNDQIYEFYCSKCEQERLTEYPCFYIKKGGKN